MSNRLAVRAFLGLTRAAQRTMGDRTYFAALSQAFDGHDAVAFTRRGPQDARVHLVQVVAVAQDHDEVWLDVFRDLEAPDDFDSLDALATEAGFDISTPLPSEYVSTVVPVAPDDDADRACRTANGCGLTLPADAFREVRERDRPPRRSSECLPCEAVRLDARKITHPDAPANYASAQRDRYSEAAIAREARGSASQAYPDSKRCDACGVTSSRPGLDFTTERQRPDALSRVCRSCTAKATYRRNHPTSN